MEEHDRKLPFDYVVIGAAGTGSRLGVGYPKLLLEVQGRTIASYLLELLHQVKHVRIVVGFRKELVMDVVRSIRDDVEFIVNDDYATTSNTYSLHLATKDLDEPYLTVDGDLLINKKSFERFLDCCEPGESLIGIARSKTEEAVFVKTDDTKNFITAFYRSPVEEFEWCGVGFFAGIKIDSEEGYIYKNLEPALPLRCKELECFEVDTPDDLELAKASFRFE